jgi:hypothetical protein
MTRSAAAADMLDADEERRGEAERAGSRRGEAGVRLLVLVDARPCAVAAEPPDVQVRWSFAVDASSRIIPW